MESIEDDFPEVIAVLVNAAKKGNVSAAQYLVSLVQPKAKFVSGDASALPDEADLSTPEGIAEVHSAIVRAAAAGKLDPDSAAALSNLVQEQRRVVETVTIANRLRILEAKKVVSLEGLDRYIEAGEDAGESGDDAGDQNS